MSLEIVVSDATGTRILGEQNLPLHIGTSTDADIRIPGAIATGDVAQIGVLDDRAFVQVPGAGNVTVNDEPVSSTRWLEPGDILLVAGIEILCESSPGKLEIRVDYRDVEYETAPPQLAGDTTDPEPGIKPLRVRRAAAGVSDRGNTRARRGYYAVAGALILLLLAAAYMFTAVTVVIRTEYENSVFSLPGSWLTPGGNGRYLLWPGNYEVLIETPGFEALYETITVAAGDRAEYNFELKELPGRVLVKTIPEAAGEVWIDGRAAGVLPTAEVKLPAGNYELRIRTERFLEYIATVEVAGRDRLQTFEAELVPGWADVSVSTNPAGAEIVFDDEVLGVTPATVELLAGSREIVVRKSDWRAERRALNIVAGQAEEIPVIELVEAGGLIRVSSQPEGATVTLGNDYQGNTPLDIEVAKGHSYRLRVSQPGYQTATRTVEVAGGEPVPVDIVMQPRLGVINITASPADATLYVDGRSLGNASQQLELIAVPHRLEIRKAGYESWASQVTPKPGLEQQLDVRLLTPEQAVIAAIPKVLTSSQRQVLQLIEPGDLMLGAPRREQGRRPNETRRSVSITRHFYLGREEVSNREFWQFRATHTSGADKYRELAGDDHPVVMLSWQDAAAYCNWLSEKEGLQPAYVVETGKLQMRLPPTNGYRLPTEAEWAWVARYGAAGKERKYPWGSGLPPPANSGNYADMSAEDVATNTISGFNDGYPVTSPGAAFPPNEAGIYDLGGNVSEWVNDYYAIGGSTQNVQVDPLGPGTGEYHVIRGSSWRQSSISELRLAYRDFGDKGRLDVGFRLARYVEDYSIESTQ
ncbi:MAG: PEGA domain-containing protein [Gammaproteobacteria bacterium]|nr:PEGA domain-containing protein [Gammaproteobacteria bacterium]MDP6616383.1 PEGA domain-containing protein [Gammaproteobacteria bacterium]MDP6695713.1 PEGA domain-containing protein [Gammaproteobacteria bacterium]